MFVLPKNIPEAVLTKTSLLFYREKNHRPQTILSATGPNLNNTFELLHKKSAEEACNFLPGQQRAFNR
ncbi:hypothetical protein CI238_12702 [Colletotrichum incanum]|uniref:Uncharacterized protein n=1 Tax=Colletotrichum incanum TaxID=1573173 RepID=A0A167DYI3_COLIC|nr:hypothetical protein CI238_12702 [Colletotrichum incanum]